MNEMIDLQKERDVAHSRIKILKKNVEREREREGISHSYGDMFVDLVKI